MLASELRCCDTHGLESVSRRGSEERVAGWKSRRGGFNVCGLKKSKEMCRNKGARQGHATSARAGVRCSARGVQETSEVDTRGRWK
jgi:hypothetical protein